MESDGVGLKFRKVLKSVKKKKIVELNLLLFCRLRMLAWGSAEWKACRQPALLTTPLHR